MSTSDRQSRTPKTPRKPATSKTATPSTTDAPVRKRTAKKTVTEAPHSESVTQAARAAAAALASMSSVRPAEAPVREKTSAPAVAPEAAAAAPAVPTRPAATVTAPPPSVSARSVNVATGARPDPILAKVIDADERRRMIQEAAYHKFLQRGPGNGTPAHDWIEAEAEIDALLAEEQLVRTQ